MNREVFTEGELIWIPANVSLASSPFYDEDEIYTIKATKKPNVAIFLKLEKRCCKVLYNKQIWYVGISDVYKINGDDLNVY